jgi:hypothetical protein
MYSPKIAEKLIPVLYRMAKDRGVPMTALVNRLLTEVLAQENLPPNRTARASASTRPQIRRGGSWPVVNRFRLAKLLQQRFN